MSDVDAMIKARPKLDFVPVIFANGVDDDLPGVVAAFKNERVQYGEKIFEPFEDIFIFGKKLAFSCAAMVIVGDQGQEMTIPPNPGAGDIVRIRYVEHCRLNHFHTCRFIFSIGPRS